MRPGRFTVHVGRTRRPVLLAQVQNFIERGLVADVSFCDVFDVGPVLVLADFEVVFARVEQIPHFLHVDFKDGDFELELQVLGRFLNGVEKVLNLNGGKYTIRGIKPFYYQEFQSAPCMVQVLPELVCPYAIIVPLNPSRMFMRIGAPTSS